MLQTNVASARLDEQHQGPGLKAHVTLNLHSHLAVLNRSFLILSYRKNYPKLFCLITCRRLLHCFPPFVPPLFWALGLAFQCQSRGFDLGDHLHLDNIAVQQSVSSNNAYKKDKGYTWGNCFHTRC